MLQFKLTIYVCVYESGKFNNSNKIHSYRSKILDWVELLSEYDFSEIKVYLK